jgi:transcriptional regulator with XRE-family HTH domain
LSIYFVKKVKIYFRDDEFLIIIGRNVRKLRTTAGLTQTELAFLCNDSDYSQINRIELGKINFSVSYLTLLSTALKVEITEIISN